MSSYDSYLSNHQLPDNETYKTIHNILAICTCVTYGLCYLIIYLSPPSKESHYYKVIVHSQGATIFLFCIQYSLVINFFYCEGYCYLIGLTCGNSYTILCFIFGTFGFILICNVLFRLYLIVDHTHFLRKPNMFPIICVVLVFFFSFLSTITFHIGYSEFDPSSLPFNLSQRQLDYLSTRTALSYHLNTFKEIFYPVYFVFLVLMCFVTGSSIAFEIVRTIHKKQSVMSTGASIHHLRVLKVLTIQIVCTASVSCCTPLALALSFFIPVNSTVIYSSSLVLGTSSLVQSVLTICLNPVTRKTVLTLIGFHKPEARKATVRVDAK